MVVLNLIVKPLWIFGIDRNVQIAVGNVNYGTYFAMLNLTFVFSILLDLGLTIYTNRTIAANPESLQHVFANVLWAKLFLMSIYFGVLGICCYFFYNDAFHFKLLVLLAFLQFLNSFLQFLRSTISANHNFKMDSLLSVLDKLIVIGICGFILLTPSLLKNFTINQFVYIQILGYTVAIILAWFVSNSYAKKIQYGLEISKVFVLIKQGIPYTIIVLLMGVYTRSDAFLLERLLPDGQMQSGYYASIYRLLDTCNMLGFLFAGMLLPIFARLLGGGKSVVELVGLSVDILLPISIGIVCFSWFNKQEIMFYLTKENNAQHALAFAILMCSFPALCVMNVYSTLLTAHNKLNVLFWICGIGAILSICLNVFCIPHFGYVGAAVVSVIVQWTVAIFFLIQSKNIFILPTNISKLISLGVLSISLLILNYFLFFMHANFLINIALNAIVFLSLVWVLKLWDLPKLLQYINQKSVN